MPQRSRQAGNQNIRSLAMVFQLDLNAHPHEKERYDSDSMGEAILKRAPSLRDRKTVQDHACGECTDDGGKFGDIGEPGKKKRKTDPEEQLQVLDPRTASGGPALA